MKKNPLFALTLSLASWALMAQGPPCDEDIILINGAGCASPCCYQDPANSGHLVFRHKAVERIDIRGNPASILSVAFPNLVSVEKSIRISYNQPGAVASISFPALRSAGSIEIAGNSGLVEVDLPRLMVIDNEDYDAFLKIQSNANLQSLNVPLLERVSASQAGTGYIQIKYNHALPSIDLPLLKTVEAMEDYGEAYIFIQGNDGAQHVDMKSLRRLSAGFESISYLIIDDMLTLEEISFQNLTELLPTGGPYNFNEITIGHSPQLDAFVFPSLERVSLLQLSGLKGTSRAMFPKLSELDYLWVFRSCADPDSTLKMYVCGEQPIMDTLFNNDDGLCGPTGYMLYSENLDNAAACDASPVCQSFIPDVNECKCNSPGLCTVESN